ncbi:MAG: phage polymerase-related protein [Gemmatimonadetes bacterium]|nr:phage polymerase-related protein [Gemmatimonadota bacterium]
MGESELVLDSLTVDDALRLLGAKSFGGLAPATAPAQARVEARVDVHPPERISESAAPAAPADQMGGSGDWREALRATGASPGEMAKKKVGRFEFPADTSAASEPVGGTPAGLSAGTAVGGSTSNMAPTSGLCASLNSLEEIAAHVASCTRCPLYATATNPVPGEGNPNADLMCVGEAPGATEDETGRPFIGAAGQLLTKILEAIKLSRDEVYICNVLKHRPPGNRNPLPEEVTACSPYLIRQIELVKPKVIIALGTFAAQTLLNSQLSLGKLRGQIHRYHGVPLIVTYHPAALLRNPSWKRPTWEDVQLARRILDSATIPGA